jgi:chromosome partitioning protein
MRVLYHLYKKKILLVDLDPQFNLTQCLMSRAAYEKLKQSNTTVFSAMEPPSSVGLFDVATTHVPPPPASTLTQKLRWFTTGEAYLDLVPGNFDLVKYSLISDQAKLALVKTRFLQFISSAKQEYDITVIDCNPSSSFITLCALHACSHILVPVRPDRYSVLGLELLSDFLDQIPTIHPKPAIAILLNGIPSHQYDPSTENELRGHSKFGTLVLTSTLRQSKLLVASSGYTGFATDKPVSYRDLLRTEISSIATELVSRWGI